eukprot:157254-Karenia_brevis.AAC.1
MGRLALYDILEFVHTRIPEVVPAVWVDDIPLRCYGTHDYVRHHLTRAVLAVNSGLHERGLSIADKSV